MYKLLRKLIYGVVLKQDHRFGKTCLDCGFLAFRGLEVTTANRILLNVKGKAGAPQIEMLNCSRSLWVDYDLIYASFDAKGIYDELQKQRKDCEGFFSYRPGVSPKEHQKLLLKIKDNHSSPIRKFWWAGQMAQYYTQKPGRR